VIAMQMVSSTADRKEAVIVSGCAMVKRRRRVIFSSSDSVDIIESASDAELTVTSLHCISDKSIVPQSARVLHHVGSGRNIS